MAADDTAPVRVRADVQVGLLVPADTVEDDGQMWDAYQGLLRARAELGVGTTVYTTLGPGEYDEKVDECADDGNDLCVSVGFQMSQATLATAEARCVMALSALGTEPWPDVPRAISRIPRGTFSLVDMPT